MDAQQGVHNGFEPVGFDNPFGPVSVGRFHSITPLAGQAGIMSTQLVDELLLKTRQCESQISGLSVELIMES